MMVEHVLAGQSHYSKRARHQEPPGVGPGSRFAPPQPQQLWPQGLRGERGTTNGKHFIGAVALGELLCLGGGPRVDAVKDGGSQRLVLGPYREQAGAYPADAYTSDRGPLSPVQASQKGSDVRPPNRVSVMLDPTGLGQRDAVRPFHGVDQGAI